MKYVFMLNMLYSYFFPFGLSWPMLSLFSADTDFALMTFHFFGGDEMILENLNEAAKHL